MTNTTDLPAGGDKPKPSPPQKPKRKKTPAKRSKPPVVLTGRDVPKNTKRGRPPLYTPELAERFCRELASGRMQADICRDEGMPSGTVLWEWRARYPSFAADYARAKLQQCEALAAQTLKEADDILLGLEEKTIEDPSGGVTTVRTKSDLYNRARLRVDTRKWLLSKMFPRDYGDLVGQRENGPAPSEIIYRWREPGEDLEVGADHGGAPEAGEPGTGEG